MRILDTLYSDIEIMACFYNSVSCKQIHTNSTANNIFPKVDD